MVYTNNDTHFEIHTTILAEDAIFSFFIFAFVVISIVINISISSANDSANDECIAKCTKCTKCTLRWELHVFFLLLPITTVAVHGNHILIGFIHTPYHATGIGTLYGIIIVTCIAILKISHHLFGECVHLCVVSVYPGVVSSVVSVYSGVVVVVV